MTNPLIADEIFRAYDIRGVVGTALNDDTMTLIGRAIGSEALDQGETTLILAADARLSSPSFTKAIRQGILATGCNIIDIGIVPTPLMYFATHTLHAKSGVMVTGSHNPKDYNGVKIVLKQRCLVENQIKHLQQRILNNDLHFGQGQIHSINLKSDYINKISYDIKITTPMTVVVDCGNGVTGNIAPDLFEALGCKVIKLFCEPDGHFPNHHPDPTVKENLHHLIDKVKLHHADLGIAFDGDGDRVILVSQQGNIINADDMMLSFIASILPENPGAKIVFDVKSSQRLPHLIKRQGGVPVMCKSGHSYVKQTMQEASALLGGEYSAHIFFKHRWYGFDDGQYTAARYLELLSTLNCSADSLLQNLPKSFCTEELSISVSDDTKFSLMEGFLHNMQFIDARINTLDGLKATFPNSWGLIRASNTTPKLVLRFEADSKPALATVIDVFKQEISRLHPELTLDF